MGIYLCVARARGSAIFNAGDLLTVNVTREGRTPIAIDFSTTYVGGYGIPAPLDFLVCARGEAKDIHEASETFVPEASQLHIIIAFSVNACMGILEPELVIDVSPDTEEHEFLHSFVEATPLITIPNRRIDPKLVNAMIACLVEHNDRARLQRGMNQYTEALGSWHPGRELMCLAHLYMGIEAITKAVLRTHSATTGKSGVELATEWGVERKNVESETRRRLIFREDDSCYKTAKKVSDAFEHGFQDYGQIRKPAMAVLVKTAEYLRLSILESLGMERSLVERALSHESPRGPLKLVKYIKGKFRGKAEDLPQAGEAFPRIECQSTLKSVSLDAGGKYAAEVEDKRTLFAGDGVQMGVTRYEVWDGSRMRMQSDKEGEDTTRKGAK